MSTKIFCSSYNKMFDTVLQSIVDCKFQKKTVDKKLGQIIAETGLSLRSWGEKIEIKPSKVKEGIKVTISSTATSQLTDWGKNEENIKKLFFTIEKKLLGK